MTLKIKNLKDSSEFLNILFDNINSALFIVDNEIKVREFNNAFSLLLNRRAEDIIGKLCGNALGCAFTVDENALCGEASYCKQCDLRKSLIFGFTKQVPTDKQHLLREFYINGVKVPKHFLYTTRYIVFDGKEMILMIVDDITELEESRTLLEKQNEELKSLNKLKNEFLGIAAHDLRNPIGAIWSFSSILLDAGNTYTEFEKQKFVKMIADSSQFSLHLLNELLDIVRIESGKLEVYMENVDYKQFVLENINLNQIFAHKKNIQIELIVPGNFISLKIDKAKINQVLNNLISNAIKFSESGKIILVEIVCENEFITTHVMDQGLGIPAEEQSKLFKVFSKTSVKTTAGEGSTGLGLSIVKKIIHAHDGKIGVKSEPGIGSDFWFKLPLIHLKK